MRRESLHPGGDRRPFQPSVVNIPIVEEEVFQPEASSTDDNPFPQEMVSGEETTVDEESAPDYESMTVEELRALCRAEELPVSGTKAELIARLTEPDAPSEEAAEATEDAPSEEAASSDDTIEGEVSESGETEREETSQ
mgnify:CR=1 FL=1